MRNNDLTTFMLKKTWLYSPFAQKKFERTTFRNAKKTERNERWTFSPLRKSRADSVLPGRPFFCICRIIPHRMMRFLFLAISRSIRGLCKECFCQRFSAEKHSPRLSDAEGRILLPKFSVCEKGRPLGSLSSGVRCALILQQRPSVCETARI